MYDYSLDTVKTRPAQVGDKLTTRLFETGTRGFCAPEDASVAVCLLPGTELSFTEEVRRLRPWPWSRGTIKHRTAIFRQINREVSTSHGIPRWSDHLVDVSPRRSTSDSTSVAGDAPWPQRGKA